MPRSAALKVRLERRRRSDGRLPSSEFFELLRRRTRRNAEEMDRRIENDCVEELAILACDSSGFTRKTAEYGILQFLAVMTRCYDALIPVIEKHRGECIAHGADNILAVFPKPADAVSAGVGMHRWLARQNKGRPESEQFNVCIGVAFGSVLRLKDNIFGDRVNLAAKMGEDLAGRDEILVTRDVAERIKSRFKTKYSRSTELGGRTIELHRVLY